MIFTSVSPLGELLDQEDSRGATTEIRLRDPSSDNLRSGLITVSRLQSRLSIGDMHQMVTHAVVEYRLQAVNPSGCDYDLIEVEGNETSARLEKHFLQVVVQRLAFSQIELLTSLGQLTVKCWIFPIGLIPRRLALIGFV